MNSSPKCVLDIFVGAFARLGDVIEIVGSLPLLGFELVYGKALKSYAKDIEVAKTYAKDIEVGFLDPLALENSTSLEHSIVESKTSMIDDAARFDELKRVMQYPAHASATPQQEFRKLSASEIRETIVKFVPESAGWIAPRSNGTKALDFLVKSYTHGFPALPPAASAHCAEGVRLIVGALADPDSAGLKPGRAKVLAQALAEAYTGCQAVQARTVDMLQGEIRGLTSQSLPAQLRVLIEEFREAALDRMVCHFHPGAPTAGDGTPHLQLPHLANKYRRHLGSCLGISESRMEAARADRNASGPLPVAKEVAEEKFWQEFDAKEICRAVVADVNQASEEAERRIDRRLLLEWCGSHDALGYEVFYDESMAQNYGDMKPSADQEAMRQPFIHDDFACKVLLSALDA